ncbi:MAG: plastocyanin/azurin family copper-binding protein [Candidatus Nitrosopolaris sp.]
MLRNNDNSGRIIVIAVVTTILITVTNMTSGSSMITNDYQVFAKSDKNSDSTLYPTGVKNPTTTTNNNDNHAGSGGKNQVVIVGIKHAKSFSPNPIVIKVGDTVTWTNDHREAHTVTSKSSEFDSGNIQPGQSYSHTFDKAGSFQYYCVIHPSMVGTVNAS